MSLELCWSLCFFSSCGIISVCGVCLFTDLFIFAKRFFLRQWEWFYIYRWHINTDNIDTGLSPYINTATVSVLRCLLYRLSVLCRTNILPRSGGHVDSFVTVHYHHRPTRNNFLLDNKHSRRVILFVFMFVCVYLLFTIFLTSWSTLCCLL